MSPIDLSVVRRVLDELKSWDLRVVSVDGVKSLLTPALVGLRMEAPCFEVGLRLFRARAMPRPTSRQELWCPSFGATKLGRVNREKDVVFYSTTTRDGAIFEIQPQKGDTVGLGIWETTTDIRVSHLGYLPALFGEAGSRRPVPPWARHPTVPDTDPANLELAKLIESEFTQQVPLGQEHRYKISVAVGEVLLDAPDIDALAYPALRMRWNADNLALKPQVAERVLQFAGAEYLRIEEVLNPGYRVALLASSDRLSDDGRIQWKVRNVV